MKKPGRSWNIGSGTPDEKLCNYRYQLGTSGKQLPQGSGEGKFTFTRKKGKKMIKNTIQKYLESIWNSQWKNVLFPICFASGGLLNFAFFYMGLAYVHNPVRTYGYILGEMIFAALCGLSMLSALVNIKMKRSSWVSLSAGLLLFGVFYALGFIKYGVHSIPTYYFIPFVTYALPAFCVGICGALSHIERDFFSLMERISFFVFPAGLIYFNGLLFNCNPFGEYTHMGRQLGIIDYMPVASALMPFLLAHIVQFADRKIFEMQIGSKKTVLPQWLRGVFIVVYWVGIIGSGTRSIYFCVIGFCVLLIISRVIHRESIKRTALLSLAMAAFLLFNIFIYAPPGMRRGTTRMEEFIAGLAQGKIITDSKENADVQDKLDDLVKAGNQQQVANKPQPGTDLPEQMQPGTDLPEENTTETLQILNRGTLYKLAWKEFLKSPLIGMGAAGAFKYKYGLDPHQVILQLLAEGGLLLGGPLLLLVLFAIIRLLRIGWTNRGVRYVLLFLLAYAIFSNTNGNIWKDEHVLCAMGYALAYQIPSMPKETVNPILSDTVIHEKK